MRIAVHAAPVPAPAWIPNRSMARPARSVGNTARPMAAVRPRPNPIAMPDLDLGMMGDKAAAPRLGGTNRKDHRTGDGGKNRQMAKVNHETARYRTFQFPFCRPAPCRFAITPGIHSESPAPKAMTRASEKLRADLQSAPPLDPRPPARRLLARCHQREFVGQSVGAIQNDAGAAIRHVHDLAGTNGKAAFQPHPARSTHRPPLDLAAILDVTTVIVSESYRQQTHDPTRCIFFLDRDPRYLVSRTLIARAWELNKSIISVET